MRKTWVVDNVAIGEYYTGEIERREDGISMDFVFTTDIFEAKPFKTRKAAKAWATEKIGASANNPTVINFTAVY